MLEIRIPASMPIWLAWKSSGGMAEVAYFEDRSGPNNCQPDRGRWDSKAIKLDSAEARPRVWPANEAVHSIRKSILVSLPWSRQVTWQSQTSLTVE